MSQTGLAQADITRMRDQLFFDGPERNRRLSRFWLLLPLSAVIASAGVVSDSTATVIGAMIVAPLMTPILGIVLAVVLTGPGRWRQAGLAAMAACEEDGRPGCRARLAGTRWQQRQQPVPAQGQHGSSFMCCGIAADLGGCQSAGDADHELRIEISPHQNRTICA